MSAGDPKAIPKKGFYRSQYRVGLPYPNYGLGPTEIPIICRCYMDDQHNFFVSHELDIHTLYKNGCFGMSSITKRGPVLSSFDRPPKAVILKQDNPTPTPTADVDMDNVYHLNPDTTVLVNKEPMDTTKVITENGSNGQITEDNDKNFIHKAKRRSLPDEKLILLPEEVIFLSFGVGCLSIQSVTTGEVVSYTKVWKDLVELNPEFPFLYAVYHYFRAKNWVPRAGLQYGGDYVLYQVGPELYHSTYIVHITGLPSRPKINWTQQLALQRVAVTTSKHVLLCEVTIPENFTSQSSSPRSIFNINIKETVVERWIPNGKSEEAFT